VKLEVPESVVLPDGTPAAVRGVCAKVVGGRLEQIVYTVEKESGAWTEVSGDETEPKVSE